MLATHTIIIIVILIELAVTSAIRILSVYLYDMTSNFTVFN